MLCSPKDLWALVNSLSYSAGVPYSLLRGAWASPRPRQFQVHCAKGGMREVGSCCCCEVVLAGALVWLHLLGSPKDLWALVNSFSYSAGVSYSLSRGAWASPRPRQFQVHCASGGMRDVGSCCCREVVLAGALVWLHLLGSHKDLWALVNNLSYSTGVPYSLLRGAWASPRPRQFQVHCAKGGMR